MKNVFKLFSIIALVAVIGFSMAACGNIISNKDDDVGNSLESFENWLSKQPSNTPDTAYTVKRNFTALATDNKSIWRILSDNPTKYVSLDLSGSTATFATAAAFKDCTSLTGIILPNNTPRIPIISFEYCTNLASVTIPNSVTSINNGAFHGCTSLTSVTIPDSVTIIESAAFSDCTSLTSVTFQGTITSNNFGAGPFPGDLVSKYLAGGTGTYTTTAPVSWSSVWTKQ